MYRNQTETKDFSANQIRALSNGIGIGNTRQRKFTHTNPQQPVSIHQTEYARVIQEQSVSYRQKNSSLYAINRFIAAIALDIIVLASIFGVGAFTAFLALDGLSEVSVKSLKLSFQSFSNVALTLTSNLKLIELILIPSTIMLIYYLGLTLLLGKTLGFSLFRKKLEKI